MRTELVITLKRKATEIKKLNRKVAVLEHIARGERAVEEGRTVTHTEARKRMARWLS